MRQVLALGAWVVVAGALAWQAAAFLAGSQDDGPPIVEQLTGTVGRVLDGDTIEVAGQVVRLKGLHAAELSDPLGRQARAAMTALALGRQVTCDLTDERTHGRRVGRCRLVGGGDLGASLVTAGLGRGCPAYGGADYTPLERAPAALLPLPGYCER